MECQITIVSAVRTAGSTTGHLRRTVWIVSPIALWQARSVPSAIVQVVLVTRIGVHALVSCHVRASRVQSTVHVCHQKSIYSIVVMGRMRRVARSAGL